MSKRGHPQGWGWKLDSSGPFPARFLTLHPDVLLYDSTDMSRWRLLILGLILVAVSATAIGWAWRKQAQRKREEAYQSALRSYSEVLRPRMTRKEVEDYLRSRGIEFRQMCCIDERSAFADLVRIGKEGAPWYCSEQNVYVAFQFAAVEPHETWKAYDSDTLKRVTIFRWLEGCL